MRPINIKKKELQELYWQEGKSQAEIASLFNCDRVTIQGWMVRLGITTRSQSEASKLWIQHHPGKHHKFPVGYKPLPRYPINIDLAKSLYFALGLGIPEIGKILNINSQVVYHRLKKAGVAFRKRGEALRGRRRLDLSKSNHSSKFQKKMAEALARSPNKPEKYLDELLQKYFPGHWEYVGDGKIIISGLCPDFINCNGLKAIIEVFGDYWHRDRVNIPIHQRDYARKAIFGKYGYKTLILWESELNQLPVSEIITKINEFTQVIE